MQVDHVITAAIVGVGATAFMDLWNALLKRGFGVASLNYCMLGRWVRHMPRRFRHENIANASQKTGECQIGWLAHYSIGVMLSLMLVFMTAGRILREPSLWIAIAYGIATVLFPFFVMQPALGLGVASAKTASPWRARLKSLSTHTAFGVGVYVMATAMR